MSTTIQIIKRGKEHWDLQKVEQIWTGAYEYEIIGRVIRDGSYYYIELPTWDEQDELVWERQSRGYQLPRGAFRALTNPQMPSVIHKQ